MSELWRDLLRAPWLQKLLGVENLVVEEDATLDLMWSSAPEAWVVFLVILPGIAAACFLWYRGERRDAGTAPKLVMAFCRGLVLLTIVLMLFAPRLTVESLKSNKAWVLVMVDDSLSMGRPDRPRLPEDQALVARAVFEKVPEAMAPAQVEELRRLTRLEVVQKALANPRMKFISALQGKINVGFYSFGGRAVAREPEALQTLAPSGRETAIGEAITQAMNEKRGQRVLGVIVLTDGRNNAGQDPRAVAEGLKDRFISVYTVAPGVARKPMDVKLTDLEAPDAVIAGDNLTVKYRLRAEGYQGESVRTRLYLHTLIETMEVATTLEEARRRVEGGRFEREKTLALTEDPSNLGEDFTLQPAQPGLYELILLTDVLEGESTEQNNFLAQRLQVVDRKKSVLYVDKWPRWEYRFLKNALIRDPMIKAHILLTSADRSFPQDCSPGLEPIREFPASMKELLTYDLVILGDVPLGDIGGPPAAELLATYASEFGGGVIFVAGTDSNPRGYHETPLTKLLPIVIDDPSEAVRAQAFDRDLPYRLTKEGEEHEITQLLEEKEKNRALWNHEGEGESLPNVRFYTSVKRLKTNARVLVTLQDPQQEAPVPLFVAMFYGRGRIFFSATDETYRWRWLRGDGPYFFPFWRRVMDWVRKGKLAGLHRFRLSVDKDRYSVGEQVIVHCNAYDANMVPLQDPSVQVFIEPPDDDRIVLELPAEEADRNGVYRGTFVPRTVGEYRLWAGDAGDPDRHMIRFTVHIPDREQENPIIDEKRLLEIAAASYVSENERQRTGTENHYSIDQLDGLARSIRGMDIALRETQMHPLWRAPLIYLIFATLITTEWILRKIYRML